MIAVAGKIISNKAVKSKYLSIHKLIPNMITLTAMAAGMSAIKFAIVGKWELAVIAIIVAGVMDAFDGAAARLLKAQSKLGAELDSLSDFLCFGVAPAFLMFLWTNNMPRVGWLAALIFAMSAALRLARFNVSEDDKDKNDPLGKYFTGVPAPVGAALCIFPMVLMFQADETTNPLFLEVLKTPGIIYAWMLVVAALMVSRIPTFSSKQIKIPRKIAVPALAFFAFLIAGLINETWPTLTAIGVLYLFMLPVGVRYHHKKELSIKMGTTASDVSDDDDEDEEGEN